MNNSLALNLPILPAIKLNLIKRVLWILVIFSIPSLIIFCVLQLNAYTKEIYLIQNYEKKLSELTQKNKILEVNFSKANSLDRIGSYVQNQAFEKVGEVKYIRLLEGTALAK